MKKQQKLVTFDGYYKRTKWAILLGNLFDESFIAFYGGLLLFILRKDLSASVFQITLFTMLKPAVSIFSFYWSSKIKKRSQLRLNFLIAGLLARIPFLLFFIFDNVWYIIFASATYMLFTRAAIPAWIEILKINLSKQAREKLFSVGAILGYSEGIAIAFFIGSALDHYVSAWKVIFLISAFLGIIGVLIQATIPIRGEKSISMPATDFSNWKQPWKDSIKLLKARNDFAHFQIGSMANGFGIMLMIPALIVFLSDVLSFSHMEMTLCRYMYMSLGFILFAPFWARAMSRFDINKLTAFIGLGFGFFAVFVLLGKISHFWVFFAYLFYGITQAGSRLIWNLSGSVFSHKQNSSLYSSVNVLTVGLRGLIAPMLGGFFCNYFGAYFALSLGAMICFYGTWHMLTYAPQVLFQEKNLP